jgi:hypothetical protein
MRQKADSRDIRQGFVVRPTLNGGWVLTDIPGVGFVPVDRGAFTNSDDLIDFIIEELNPNFRRSGDVDCTEIVIDDSVAASIARLAEASSDGK